jgi:NADH:ubiquinone oxidoreductase subunit C
MNYYEIIEKIEAYIAENFDILKFLYLREGECKYASLINHIENGKNLVQIKNEIELFYRFQGMDTEQRINLLNIFDTEKESIKSIDSNNIDKVFDLYCSLLEKTKKITGKYQYVNTAKLMNLYNQKIPLFDNNVINFLNYLGFDIGRRTKKTYSHILRIYKLINEQKNVPNIISIKNDIYSDMEIKYINLNKFVDTLMYFINDSAKISEYKKLCINKKEQTKA